MKQQTAVEFAVEKLEKFIPSGNQLAVLAILEQAKEMQKKHMINFAYAWYNRYYHTHPMKSPENIYDEIFKNK